MAAGLRLLLDTSILIDYLKGVEEARRLIDQEAGAGGISLISWIEVMVGARDSAEERALESWLARFRLVDLDVSIARRAVELRRAHRIRLPDALIWASADVNRLTLVTRNTRDFPADQPGIHVPY